MDSPPQDHHSSRPPRYNPRPAPTRWEKDELPSRASDHSSPSSLSARVLAFQPSGDRDNQRAGLGVRDGAAPDARCNASWRQREAAYEPPTSFELPLRGNAPQPQRYPTHTRWNSDATSSNQVVGAARSGYASSSPAQAQSERFSSQGYGLTSHWQPMRNNLPAVPSNNARYLCDLPEQDWQLLTSSTRYTHSSGASPAPPAPGADQIPRGRWMGAPPKSSTRPNPRSDPKHRVPDSVREVVVPKPTAEYLAQAKPPSQSVKEPRSLLLVIDLNGTLLYRKRGTLASNFTPRADMDRFVRYFLSKFSVLIWSSAKPENVARMCSRIFTDDERRRVIAEWGRDRLGLNSWQYNQKVQVYKRLQAVWESKLVAESHPNAELGGFWDQSNTVLVDDSILKAAAQPYNIVEIPEFTGEEDAGKQALRQVAAYLEELRWQSDVSAFMREKPFTIDTDWKPRGEIDGFD